MWFLKKHVIDALATKNPTTKPGKKYYATYHDNNKKGKESCNQSFRQAFKAPENSHFKSLCNVGFILIRTF